MEMHEGIKNIKSYVLPEHWMERLLKRLRLIDTNNGLDIILYKLYPINVFNKKISTVSNYTFERYKLYKEKYEPEN